MAGPVLYHHCSVMSRNPVSRASRIVRRAAPATAFVLAASLLHGQRGGNDWMTTGFDVHRSHWVRFDGKISEQTMRKTGFELVWKFVPKNTPRGVQALTPPALLDFYISYRGFRTLGFFGGSSNTVIGIDTDLARLEWQNGSGAPVKGPVTAACPGGMTSAVTRPTIVTFPSLTFGRGVGRGTPAKSGVGEPFEGSVQLKALAAPRPAAPRPAPAPPRPGARNSAPPNPFAPTPLYVNALMGDGSLHQMYVSNGEEPKAPVPFVPAGATARGLTVFDGNAYVATVNGCNGVENGLWSLSLDSKQVNHWKATGGNIAGTDGFAAGPEGDLFVASGGDLVKLAEGTLVQKAAYKAEGSEFVTSPVLFEFKGKTLAAAATKDGRLHIVDTADMRGVTRSEIVVKAGYPVGALASWQDEMGNRWLLAPTSAPVTGSPVKSGAIVSLKLVEANGSISLQPGWISRDLVSPQTPAIVNGVVFAISSGEFAPGDTKVSDAQRKLKSQKAILYALDGMTGKELWNSGTAIGGFVTSGGLSAGGGRVYLSTADGTQYAFGFPMEH